MEKYRKNEGLRGALLIHNPAQPNQFGWSRVMVEAAKADIKKELAKIPTARKKISFIISKINNEATDPLRGYVYAMNALILYSAADVLKTDQFEKLSAYVEDLIIRAGIDVSDSRIGYVYGDLLRVQSQIAMRKGNHWSALVQLGLSSEVSGRGASDKVTEKRYFRDQLGLGLRMLRLGDIRLAYEYFTTAANPGANHEVTVRAKLELMRLERMAGNWRAFDEYRNDEELLSDLVATKEIEWESLCADCQQKRSPTGMYQTSLVKRKFGASFKVEAVMWILIFGSKDDRSLAPSITPKLNRRVTEYVNLGYTAYAVAILQQCFDDEIPRFLKINRLAAVVQNIGQMDAMHKEFLMLAASLRWLKARPATRLSALLKVRYNQLSLAYTANRSDDLFSVIET